MYLGVTGTISTLFVSLFKEEISIKSQVNILTETVDYIPSLAKTCTSFE